MADRSREDAEKAAQAGMEAGGGAALARDLLREQRVGVLATLSVRHGGGHPITSLAPYALDAHGDPVLLLSALAQHTRNVEADPRASLLVHDPAAAERDPRTAPRLTLVGRVHRATQGEEPDARARYLARHPDARGLLALDFALYLLVVEEAQLVGGFGAAGWIPGDAIRGGG
jgi:putative heme iron utilization protein